MYEKRNFTYILTALEAIEKIFLYTEEIQNADEFYAENNQMNFNASQLLLLVIGEESKKISKGLREKYHAIPWHLISSLRNRIAHDYRSVDPYISFDIIQNYLPELKNTLIEMLNEVEFEKELLIKVVNTRSYGNLKYLIE